MFTTAVRGMSSMIVKRPWKIRLPKRLKGGFIEKWGDYWVTVAQDYKEVAYDVVKDSRKQPFKASMVMSLIAGYMYAVKTNPDEMEFQDTLQRYMNESAMLSEKIRNKEVDAHFNYMIDCYNHGLVRRLSLGFCSILWVDNYSKVCGVFKSRCEYLKPRLLTFHERIMDVGFLGSWWIIDKKMEEFDINLEEWTETDAEIR
ncbi:mitochondrial import inner membrane translocase subunit Tim29-like [Homarus americanus]|uniref:Mitochondrial import inner membrane translocase subunit Tim29-like n=1 Tax=Homarus americanus TaxID=6706 RepID=A0A8J5JUD5_HOMAM|nr:mitochondrial import inner membrane translocase subunit Tim29-like [Homarus americanus]KAG7164477.1 Mitochondrial import inner membrane translocase subunit Tim29-like [Homarus americanus]